MSQKEYDSSVAAKPTVRSYIEQTWVTLTRSTDNCRAYGDVKVADSRVLYLPFNYPEDDGIGSIKVRCGIQIRHLPKKITHIGEVSASSIPSNGLLYLPYPYVVPGGRFNELYGWDSYFILQGLLLGSHRELAKNILDNFIFDVDYYGGVLNANRTYYLSRSQPPFLARMVLDFYRSQTPVQQASP